MMKKSEINSFIISNGERMSNVQIAQECGIGRNAVCKRRTRLMEKGYDVLHDPDTQETVGETVEQKTALKKQTEKTKHTEKENRFLYEKIGSLEEELTVIKNLESSTETHKINQQNYFDN